MNTIYPLSCYSNQGQDGRLGLVMYPLGTRPIDSTIG